MSVGEFDPCNNCGKKFEMNDIMVVNAKIGRQWHVACYYDKKALEHFLKGEIYLYTPTRGMLKIGIANIWIVVNTKIPHVAAFTREEDAKVVLEQFQEAEKNENSGSCTFMTETGIQ